MPVRSVNIQKCIGCGTCIDSCPMDVFRLDTFVAKRRQISPCSSDCPLKLDQREYHHLVQLNLLDEAALMLRERHPMPSITGRVCPHPCETECSRSLVDEAVNINGLEQFLGDYLLEQQLTQPISKNGNKIAVVGSGPAGLSAAYFLTLSGYQVTVFEKDAKPGGILRYYVPSFRMPEEILDKQIAIYEKMGIEFKTNVAFGTDITFEELKHQGYEAYIMANGASKPLGLSVPGVDSEGIISAMVFLKAVKTDRFSKPLSSVAVIGGGSVALDAARSAIRLGAEEVNVICLEKRVPGTKESMLALESEINETLEEGVSIHDSLGVASFAAVNGRVEAVSCVPCLRVRDENGRFNPVYGESKGKTIKADLVILAIGQTADPAIISKDVPLNEYGYIHVDARTMHVVDRLFAAGDAVTGPSTVIQALASGKRVAASIDRYLKGESLSDGADIQLERASGPPKEKKLYQTPRMYRRKLDPKERITHSNEIRESLTQRQLLLEAERCLTCGSRSTIAYMDDCQVCRLCAFYCPTDAIEITDGALMSSLHNFNVTKLGKALKD